MRHKKISVSHYNVSETQYQITPHKQLRQKLDERLTSLKQNTPKNPE